MLLLFFFFKQKTAYEMRISDWSSDVCSSDLTPATSQEAPLKRENWGRSASLPPVHSEFIPTILPPIKCIFRRFRLDRKSVVSGKSVSVRVDLGGRCIIKKTHKKTHYYILSLTN